MHVLWTLFLFYSVGWMALDCHLKVTTAFWKVSVGMKQGIYEKSDYVLTT